MVTGSPPWRPANAMLWPWLPRVAETSPAGATPETRSRSMKLSPPRTLNAPVGVWFSCLTQVSVRVKCSSSGQRYVGVGGTCRATTLRA